MKAVCFQRPNHVSVIETPVPQVGPQDVLIQVEAAGICGTDLHLYVGEFDPRYPLIPGHEFSGVVVEVGDEVKRVAPGDRVAVDPNLYCDRCHYCRRDLQNHCEAWEAIGVTRPGGFAEYVVAPEQSVYPIGSLSFAEGAFIEPLACVVYGQERAKLRLGSSVLIMGAGPIGLLHLQLAKRAGAARVAVTDLRPERLQLAQKLGADFVVASKPQGPGPAAAGGTGDLTTALPAIAPYGFDLVIDATGVPAVVEQALSYVATGGTLLLFGVCPNDSVIRLNPYEIYRRDLQIIGTFALRKSFETARDLLEAKAVDVLPLIGATVNLDEFPAVLELMRNGRAPMKIQVDPQNRRPPLAEQGLAR